MLYPPVRLFETILLVIVNSLTLVNKPKTCQSLLERQGSKEVMVSVYVGKWILPERGPVVEICAGFSSGARGTYHQTDDDNMNRKNTLAIHTPDQSNQLLK